MWVLMTAIVSGALLLIFVALFQAERVKGRRILMSSWRNRTDAMIERNTESFLGVKRTLGASSLRLFFHYLLHQFLSAVIFITRFTEQALNKLRAKNRIIAKVIKDTTHDSHLARVAEHKESIAMSDEEARTYRERSLND